MTAAGGPGATLVTGASSGIGAATARRFARQGYPVVLLARREAELTKLAEEIHGAGGRALPAPADVRDSRSLQQAVGRAVGEFGSLEVLVNCAAIATPPRDIGQVDDQGLAAMLETNLYGPFYACRAAVAVMGGGGSIVNIGSELSLRGAAGYSAYCASKAGIVGLTKALARELAPRIRVNCLCPGPVDTPMLRMEFAGMPAGAEEGLIKAIPLARLGSAEDVADAIFSLATLPGTTGAVWSYDGGITS
jgi:NAD(P)-dependent dehydrogenase (short-subunit alcohol dehydrogenase family)